MEKEDKFYCVASERCEYHNSSCCADEIPCFHYGKCESCYNKTSKDFCKDCEFYKGDQENEN